MASNTENNNHITLTLNVEQRGEIKVHSQIINDLSSGIYSSPASCIKELVNNSFDADAKRVVIRMKPIEDTITIFDDGSGMNATDFDENFAWISKSNKRNKGELSPSGRPLIGKIGIGFIAVNEICDVLEITSSKKGEKIKFTATIDFSKIISKEISKGLDDDSYLKGEFTLINEEEESTEHYTSIKLLGLKEPVLKIFKDETYKAQVAKAKNKSFAKISFKSMKELLEYHSTRDKYSWENDTEYIQFIIDLASYIPVEYIDDGPVVGFSNTVIEEVIRLHKEFDFKVDFDGMYLKKPIYFPKDIKKRIEIVSFKKNIDNLKFKGYFYIQNTLLIPRELNGIAIRVKNIPIAERFGFDTTLMRYPNYSEQIFRNWISGEIYVEKGLEDAMNIDRKSFRVTHPEYLTLQDFVHEYLKETVFKKALKIYDEGKEIRDVSKEKVKTEETKELLKTGRIKFEEKTKDEQSKLIKNSSPVKIVRSKSNEVTIEIDPKFKTRFRKGDWSYLETIFIIFESALQESRGDTSRLKKLFYKKIEDWKSKK